MDEDRRHKRLPLQLPASFEVSGGEETTAVATTLDISAGGMCLSSREKLDVGQTLLIKVQIPNTESLSIFVEIVWVRTQDLLVVEEFKVGVRIIDPTQPDENKFIQFCKEY